MPNQPFHAFTTKFTGISLRITTPVELSEGFDPGNPPAPPVATMRTAALWDTGATNSVITRATAATLGLVPSGSAQVNHAGGRGVANTYVVNVKLPNEVTVVGVLVSECPDIVGDFGAIIGMDIICRGDFSITNVDGKTCMSYRVPSIQEIDYVAEANRAVFAGTNRNAPCPCGKLDAAGKPVKFKFCHGKA